MKTFKKPVLILATMAQVLVPFASMAANYRYDRYVPTLKVTESAVPGGGAQPKEGSTGGGQPPAPLPALSVSSQDLSFGVVQNGGSKVKQLLVSNMGGAALNFAQVPTVTGEGFSAATTCGDVLAASSNCQVDVMFSPPKTGGYGGTLTLYPNDGTPLTVPLSGQGESTYQNFNISAQSYNFGESRVGAPSVTRYFNVYNDGTENVTGFDVTAAGPFEVTTSCLPTTTLFPLQTCDVAVTAKPTLAQTQTGAITVSAGGVTRHLTVSVTGIDSETRLSPDQVRFGSPLSPNVTFVQAVNLVNQGPAVTYTTPTLSGVGYSLASGGTCSNTGGTLAANDSCSFFVQLNSTSGLRNGTITVTVGGRQLTSQLSGNVESTAVGFSSIRTGLSSPTTALTVLNNTGFDVPAVSASFPQIFVYSAAATARTYNVWIEGAEGIYVGTASIHSTSNSTVSRAVNSAAPFQISTTSGAPTLGLYIKVDTTTAGTHTKTATLRVVATDGSYDAALPLTANFMWNATVGDAFQNGILYSPGTTVNLGTTTYALNSQETTGSFSRSFAVQQTGKYGAIRGYWTLSGSRDFILKSVGKSSLVDGNYIGGTCGAVISEDKASSTVCTGYMSSNSSSVHSLTAYVQFSPSSVGLKTATLTFNPVDATQGSQVSFLISATGQNNVAVGSAYQNGIQYSPGTTVDMGTTLFALNSLETTGVLTRSFVIQEAGTHGMMRGYWTLSGDPEFALTSVIKRYVVDGNVGGASCGAVISVDKASSTVCTGYELSSSSGSYSLSATVQFKPISIGRKTARLIFTPVDNTQGDPVTFELSATGENNVTVGAPYSSTTASPTASFASKYTVGNIISFAPIAISQSAVRNFGVMSAGTHGKMRGTWTLSGSNDFAIVSAAKGYSGYTSACGATVATDKRSTTTCTADELSGSSSYTGILTQIKFTPTSRDVQSATLTFTPDADQGSPVSYSLSATAQ